MRVFLRKMIIFAEKKFYSLTHETKQNYRNVVQRI